MKKTHSFLALFVVWGAVLISAGALAYVLGPPLPVMGRTDAPPRTLIEVALQAPVTIHATAVASDVDRIAPAALIVKPRELRCSNWTNLSQGPTGSQVRYCE
jgi:hypothetical protein